MAMLFLQSVEQIIVKFGKYKIMRSPAFTEVKIILEVYVNDCGRTTEKVHEIVIAPGENMDAYNKVEVPLTQFARHDYVYVSFRAHTLDSDWQESPSTTYMSEMSMTTT